MQMPAYPSNHFFLHTPVPIILTALKPQRSPHSHPFPPKSTAA